MSEDATIRSVRIDADDVVLAGDLTVPPGAAGLVVFAHGSGSSRLSPRNRAVAERLNADGFATLLFDLLTESEEAVDRVTAELRFDISLLGRRLVATLDSIANEQDVAGIPVGLFGASTGAAAALIAAASVSELVGSVVSRGGRPDLAGEMLGVVTAPTLLIVGGHDRQVIELNRRAKDAMRCEVVLSIVPGSGHLFEEPGALAEVARLASAWFLRTL